MTEYTKINVLSSVLGKRYAYDKCHLLSLERDYNIKSQIFCQPKRKQNCVSAELFFCFAIWCRCHQTAQSITNSVFANFDIWMYCEEDAFSQNTQYSIFYAFAALSLNDVLSNFDIWMHNKEGASATDRSVLVVREGWCGSA